MVDSIPDYEQLALGIGNYEDLSLEALRKMCNIVGIHYMRDKDLETVRKRVAKYLDNATIDMYVQTALKLSGNNGIIDDKYTELVKNATATYQQLIDTVLTSS